MDYYSTYGVAQPRSGAAEEVAALRARVGQLERRLREEGQQRQLLRGQLMRRQAFMTRLTQAMPTALYFYSLAADTETFLNDHLGRVLGYSPTAFRQLQPQVLAALLHPHDHATIQQQHAHLRQSPLGTSTQLDARLLNALGGWQWFSLSYTVARCDGQGRATHLLGAVATRTTGEPALQQTDALADMSHEIKTPLHAIVGLAQLLRQAPAIPAQGDYLDALLANAENLLGIADGVLASAKSASLATTPFDAAAVVRRAVQSLSFAAETKGVALHLELPATPVPTVVGDARCLTQLLINLIGNALKFTAEGSITVSLAASHLADGQLQLALCVADTGIGIAAAQAERLFQRFTQASENTAERYGGTGLGLAICHSLVAQQGGRIWLESELGRGSQFHFTLPYQLSSSASASIDVPTTLPVADGLLQGLRVLLVDDNEAGALLAQTHLLAWQAVVDVATDGEQALALALSQPYDLLLLDVQLPRLNGMEVTQQLRTQPGPNQTTPIVALTAAVGDTALLSAAGFTGWLEKPFSALYLYQAIARYSGRDQVVALQTKQDYDFTNLGRLANDAGFISKMQRLFIETVPQRLAQLEATIAQQDWDAAHPLVHSLKTTYGSLQIDEAMQPLRKIEKILRNNPTYAALVSLLYFLRLATNKTTETFKIQLAC